MISARQVWNHSPSSPEELLSLPLLTISKSEWSRSRSTLYRYMVHSQREKLLPNPSWHSNCSKPAIKYPKIAELHTSQFLTYGIELPVKTARLVRSTVACPLSFRGVNKTGLMRERTWRSLSKRKETSQRRTKQSTWSSKIGKRRFRMTPSMTTKDSKIHLSRSSSSNSYQEYYS